MIISSQIPFSNIKGTNCCNHLDCSTLNHIYSKGCLVRYYIQILNNRRWCCQWRIQSGKRESVPLAIPTIREEFPKYLPCTQPQPNPKCRKKVRLEVPTMPRISNPFYLSNENLITFLYISWRSFYVLRKFVSIDFLLFWNSLSTTLASQFKCISFESLFPFPKLRCVSK